MTDIDELVGLWDSAPYDYGAMESSELALLADATGWGTWMSASGAMSVVALRWRRLDPTTIVVTELELTSGSWDPDRRDVILREEPSTALEDITTVRYELVMEIPPLMSAVKRTLKLRPSLMFATTFAYVRANISEADRPRIVDAAP